MTKIYLACPYSHDDPKVREERFKMVNCMAGILMQEGNVVFSPISHTHPIAEARCLPKGWEFWRGQDLPFIEWCDELHVLMLEGWTESVGVQAEINMAENTGKFVAFIIPAYQIRELVRESEDDSNTP